MGKGSSFSISCSKKLTQCDPYIGLLTTDTNAILLFFKEMFLANLGEKLLGTLEIFRKKKVVYISAMASDSFPISFKRGMYLQ